jgi:aconitate hydratase
VPLTVAGVGAIMVTNDLTAKELDIIKAGGLLNQVRQARA